MYSVAKAVFALQVIAHVRCFPSYNQASDKTLRKRDQLYPAPSVAHFKTGLSYNYLFASDDSSIQKRSKPGCDEEKHKKKGRNKKQGNNKKGRNKKQGTKKKGRNKKQGNKKKGRNKKQGNKADSPKIGDPNYPGGAPPEDTPPGGNPAFKSNAQHVLVPTSIISLLRIFLF